MVLAVPTSPSLGVPNNVISQNVGKMFNQGFEFNLGGNVIAKEHFNWNTNVNLTFVKNEVQELAGGNDITSLMHVTRVGHSIGSFYGYEFTGVNSENGNPIYLNAEGNLVQQIVGTNGNYALYDPNNKADVSQASSLGEKKILGNSNPTWFGGFNNNFSYKGLDLVINMSFSGGNKVYNRTRQESLNNMEMQNAGVELLDRWTTVGQETDVPKLMYGYGAQINLENSMNSRFLENGNFLRMRTIGLGYTFKNTVFLNSINLSRLKIFANVENAFVITNYSGIDPEVSSSFTTNQAPAMDYMSNPVPRTYTVGINVGF